MRNVRDITPLLLAGDAFRYTITVPIRMTLKEKSSFNLKEKSSFDLKEKSSFNVFTLLTRITSC